MPFGGIHRTMTTPGTQHTAEPTADSQPKLLRAASKTTGGPALLAAALAFTAGFADSQSYLNWHLFGANMTGNTVLFGIAATTGNLSQAITVLEPILAFIAGCGVATLFLGVSQSLCFVIEAATLIAAAFTEHSPEQLALISLAMGVQNATVKTFGSVQANTSFITGNYERLGQVLARMATGKAGIGERDTLVVVTPLLVSYAIGAAMAATLLLRQVPHILLFVVVIITAVASVTRRNGSGGSSHAAKTRH
jgi:uncharacterized membrane protein YoaK (UPF0700 family)